MLPVVTGLDYKEEDGLPLHQTDKEDLYLEYRRALTRPCDYGQWKTKMSQLRPFRIRCSVTLQDTELACLLSEAKGIP